MRDNSHGTTELQPLMVKPSQAAKLLQVCEKTLWTWTKDGTIPAIKVGGVVRYSVDALRQWITNRTKNKGTGSHG